MLCQGMALAMPHKCMPHSLVGAQLYVLTVCWRVLVVLQEWVQQQEAIKNETLEIVYSYWDGSGHRRKVRYACAVHSQLL
jgi:hypothetical protein